MDSPAAVPISGDLSLILSQKLLLKWRDLKGTLFELLIPVAIVFILVSIAQISQVIYIPANNYAEIPRYPNRTVLNATVQVLEDMLVNASLRAFRVGGEPVPIFPAELRPCGESMGKEIPLGKLAFAPRSKAQPLVDQLNRSRWTGDWFRQCTVSPTIFETEEDAVKWAHNDTQSEELWALIVVEVADHTNAQYRYKIRTRNSFVAQSPFLGLAVQPYTLGRGIAFRSYFTSGFTSLQHLLATMIFCSARPESCTGDLQKALVEGSFAALTIPFPVEDVKQNLFFEAATGFVPLLFVIAFIYPLSKLVKSIVEEKELRLKELLLTMSLHPIAYKLSWVVISEIQAVVAAVLVTLAMMILYAHVSFWLLFVLIALYCQASVAFCFFIAGFFSKARTAVLASVLILFATEIPFLVLTEHPSYSTQVVLSVLPNMAFSYAMKHVGAAEAANTAPALDEGQFTILEGMVLLLLDIALYHILAWYFAEVMPGEFGAAQKPWFLFTKAYWYPSGVPCSVDWNTPPPRMPADDEGLVEEVAADRKPFEQVRIRNLRKVFGNFVAVNGLSLAMYENSITVLLGHNGAGKTTTINMLTGMLSPTDGDCQIFGRSILHNMQAIRRDIGVCPQHNVLWPNYSVREHLTFFAKLKGVTHGIEQAVEDMIAAIDLRDKADVHSAALSGGMKRRLSVGIALIGGSRLVFLDEPTAGMDPEAREHTHRLLVANTRGRVIILTTHFMDEADKLGDRIAILSQGTVRCCGSPLFLKSRLGVGYSLNISLGAGAQPERLMNAIQTHIPSAQSRSVSATELTVLLQMDTVALFGSLFRSLEDHSDDLGIASFGISMTKLEDVFLRIALEDEDTVQGEDGSPLTPAATAWRPDGRAGDTPLLHGEPDRQFRTQMEELPLITAPSVLLPLQFQGMIMKRLHIARRDRWFQFCLMVLPVLVVLGALLLTELVAPNPSLDLTPQQYPALTHKPTEVVLADLRGKYEWRPEYTDVSYFRLTNSTAATSLNVTRWMLDTLRSHGVSRYGGFVIDDTIAYARDGAVRMDTVMHNSTAFHALPTFYGELLKVKLRKQLARPDLNLTFVGHTMPMTARAEAAFNTLKLVGAAIIILFPFTFIPANFASFLVKERMCKAKHVQVVSGVNLVVFWLSSICWDMLQYSVTVFLTMMTFWAFNKKEYVGDPTHVLATLSLFTLYGLASTSLAYLCHFPFTNHSTSQNALMLANLICGVVLVIASQIMSQIDSTKVVNSYLVHWYRLLPAYCLGEGLLNLSLPIEFFTLVLKVHVTGPFDVRIIGRSLIYLAVEAPAFFLLTLLCDMGPPKAFVRWRSASRWFGRPRTTASAWEGAEDEDDDVRREREVERADGRPEDFVTVQRLCKEYPARGNAPAHKAVRGLSFGVHEGEIFALLGVNGAGKTTTLSILSGEFPMTQGRALLNGFDIAQDLRAARQGLGYCPQFDALLDLMSVEEHLYMYCRLRGIALRHAARCVQHTMQHLGLTQYAKKEARKLSGGNKRKLSLGIALIGGPKVVMLDEPSAGMDPVARRGMCEAIATAAQGRAVILTTHHLEEVEALANRVGIMAAGEFKCLGSLTHLKAKFGEGYWLEFRVPDQRRELVLEFVKNKFGEAAVEEVAPGYVKMKAPGTALRLSFIFEEIEKHRASLGVQDYAVSQPTLEQVFLNISEMQEMRQRIRSESEHVVDMNAG